MILTREKDGKFASPWTAAEKDLLREKYATSLIGELEAMLPGRTRYAIASKAREMGLKTSIATCLRGNIMGKVIWTDWEKYHLRHIFATSSARELRAAFPTRTDAAIKVQADALGLRRTFETIQRIRKEARELTKKPRKPPVVKADAPDAITRKAIAQRTPLEQAWSMR